MAGGSGNSGRGGSTGNQGSGLRGHGSRAGGNFNQNRRNQGSGGFQQGGSFRNRNQGHSNQNRSGNRQEAGSNAQKEPAVNSAAPGGKKEENKRTLTDFKIVGLEIPELEWSWGVLPSPPAVKTEPVDSVPNISVKDEVVVDDKSALKGTPAGDVQDSQAEASAQVTEVAEGAETQKTAESQAAASSAAVDVNGASQPPSRMRIYFDTPVTADDSKPIPHSTGGAYVDSASERKGKRKKLEDDDGDLEEGRGRPPPPRMTMNDDRSSVSGSVVPSASETSGEKDWLMAAIVDGDEEAQAAAELQPHGEEEVDGGEHVLPGDHDAEGEDGDFDTDADAEGEVEVLVDDGGAPTSSDAPESPEKGSSVVNGGDHDAPVAPVSPDITSTSRDDSLFEATEEQSSDQPDSNDARVDGAESPGEQAKPKSLHAASADPTLLIVEDTEFAEHEQETQFVDNGEYEQETQQAPESLISPAEDSHPPVVQEENLPSANRLSISYASGNRRLVVDAEVVSSLKLHRKAGRIEVVIDLTKSQRGIKGVLVESLSDAKTYANMSNILANDSETDATVPPFSKLTLPTSVHLIARLDVHRPLSEPKWARSGDIQEWLKSMLGSDDASGGWGHKIHVVDPDPPPTIWTVLEGWAGNSPVGLVHERQRFLKTHMTETDNMLEILLRLVRGERATAFQNAPSISAPSVSGVLASALTPGSAHGAQQTHVSLAVLALFRMAVEYAQKIKGDEGRGEVETRMGEIIRCLPLHLVHKSLDGIFKEWKAEKKGGR